MTSTIRRCAPTVLALAVLAAPTPAGGSFDLPPGDGGGSVECHYVTTPDGQQVMECGGQSGDPGRAGGAGSPGAGSLSPFFARYIKLADSPGGVFGGSEGAVAIFESGNIPPPMPPPADWDGFGHPCGARQGGAIVFGVIASAEKIDRATNRILARHYVCLPLHGAPQAPWAEPPTIQEIWRSVPVPTPMVLVSPKLTGLTGMETWFWYDQATEVQISVNLDGWTVTGTARLTSVEWDTGDHHTRHVEGTYDAPVRPSTEEHHAAHYVYETKGHYVVSVTAQWSGRVHLAGPDGDATDADIGTLRLVPVTRDYDVLEVRASLIPTPSHG